MPASSSAESLAQQARFVFKGTVKKLNAATLPEIEDTDRTVIVRVDEIIHAAEVLSHYAGQDITVRLSDRKKVKVGQQAVFFTNGWLYGKSVAVQSLGQHPVGKATAALLSATADPVRNLADRDMKKHYDDADLVVSGKVTSVRLAEDVADAPRRLPPSEHDPHWQEAVVEVDAVHKGKHDKKTVVIRFPSSRDIVWADAPKFRPGQEGHFLLHKAQKTQRGSGRAGARLAEAAGAGGEEAYTALHADDFQPLHQPDGIKALINAPSPDDH